MKTARIGMISTQNVNRAWAWLYVGAATVEIGEPTPVDPKFAEVEATGAWVNEATVPVHFKAADRGLGVKTVSVSEEAAPCSRGKQEGAAPASPKTPVPPNSNRRSTYRPRVCRPAGTGSKIVAEDPLGRVSTEQKEGLPTDAHVVLYVDHRAPSIALSGMLAEQGVFGTKRTSYPLKVSATDGNASVPQSGVAKVSIKIDGTVVDETAPGCSTENCAITREWTLDPTKYAVGPHTVEVTATDGVGLTTTETFSIELHPAPAPTLTLTGTLTEQATVGSTRPSYTLKAAAASQADLDSAHADLRFRLRLGRDGKRPVRQSGRRHSRRQGQYLGQRR